MERTLKTAVVILAGLILPHGIMLADETTDGIAPTDQATAGPKASATPRPRPVLPPPPPATFANVPYGEHERQVLDFWKADSAVPTPVLFWIHGGAWNHGDKALVENSDISVKDFLKAGISVVSINYRYSGQSEALGIKPPVKGVLDDAARSLQFVRSKAAEWNIDKKRIAVAGGSAGGCSSLWLAFHDDLADPNSKDPVARESTKPYCAAVIAAQTTLDPKQLKEWIPNIVYGPHAFGIKPDYKNRAPAFEVFLASRDTILPWIKQYSPYALVSADDPPVFLYYRNAPGVGEYQANPNHSANFGVKLYEHCQEVGAPCELIHGGMPRDQRLTVRDYLMKKLGPEGNGSKATQKPSVGGSIEKGSK